MKWATMMLAAVVVLVAAPACTDFKAGEDIQAGVDAYEKGDYATALKEWRPLAERGHAGSQVLLGGMYARGEGVPKDHTEALRWYRLAAAQGDEDAFTARETLEKKMTPAQIAEAHRLAREWKPESE